MAQTATQTTQEAFDKDPEKITKVDAHVPGVGLVATYWETAYVDDISKTADEGTDNYAFSVPVQEKDEESGETTWSVKRYEIDLSPKNRDAMLKALAKYMDAGREITTPIHAASTAPAASATTEWRKRIRNWAMNEAPAAALKGWAPKERGRIPEYVEASYVETHPQDPQPTA